MLHSRKKEKRFNSKYKEQLKENEGNWKKIEDITYVYNSAVSNLNQLILEDPDYQDSVDAVREKVQQYAIYREGFFLDLAAAAEWNFDNGIVDKGKLVGLLFGVLLVLYLILLAFRRWRDIFITELGTIISITAPDLLLQKANMLFHLRDWADLL